MKFAVALILAGCAWAQSPTLSLTTSSPVYPGAIVTVTVSLANSAGANIAGLGFTLPAGATNPVAGAASTAAAKTIWYHGLNTILIGATGLGTANPQLNANAYADGPVLTFNYSVPAGGSGSALNVALANVVAAGADASAVSISTTPLSVRVGLTQACTAAILAAIAAFEAAPTEAALLVLMGGVIAGQAVGSCK